MSDDLFERKSPEVHNDVDFKAATVAMIAEQIKFNLATMKLFAAVANRDVKGGDVATELGGVMQKQLKIAEQMARYVVREDDDGAR